MKNPRFQGSRSEEPQVRDLPKIAKRRYSARLGTGRRARPPPRLRCRGAARPTTRGARCALCDTASCLTPRTSSRIVGEAAVAAVWNGLTLARSITLPTTAADGPARGAGRAPRPRVARPPLHRVPGRDGLTGPDSAPGGRRLGPERVRARHRPDGAGRWPSVDETPRRRLGGPAITLSWPYSCGHPAAPPALRRCRRVTR